LLSSGLDAAFVWQRIGTKFFTRLSGVQAFRSTVRFSVNKGDSVSNPFSAMSQSKLKEVLKDRSRIKEAFPERQQRLSF